MEKLIAMGKLSKSAAKKLAIESTIKKNAALLKMAEALMDNKDYILRENEKDMEKGRSSGIQASLLDRLMLSEKRIENMCEELKNIVTLPDPIGEIIKNINRPNNLKIGQVRVPLGVIGIIYEARPNVTVDAAALCIKAGNAVILRGGVEAINSNIAISNVIAKAAVSAGLPEGCIQLIYDTDRETALKMMKLNDYIDVLIPRGGAGLIKTVINNSTVPYIQTGVGNCHVYVHSDGNLDMAENIIINAKTSRPGVCNSMETLLVHEAVAGALLPSLSKKLISLGVELRGCPQTMDILQAVTPAVQSDWETEYLDLILVIKVVKSLDEALEHISEYSTKHSEAIITDSYSIGQRFLNEVDAAAVYINASTRFTDGSEFGYGAEIGISTQKLHARGPMGLNELTSIKYIIYGEGQIRE